MTTTTTTLDTIHQQHHSLTVDAIARVILSCVLEPGDSDAGKLVDDDRRSRYRASDLRH